MSNSCTTRFSLISIASAALLATSLNAGVANAQVQLYKPIPLQVGNPVQDTLSAQDIPTGQRGFARDYVVSLSAGDQVTISLSSDSFDSFVSLFAADGSPVGENDDDPDGSTNSRLSVRIPNAGNYIVRVRSADGAKSNGSFTLKVTRQRPES
jgi:hypothetical protein